MATPSPTPTVAGEYQPRSRSAGRTSVARRLQCAWRRRGLTRPRLRSAALRRGGRPRGRAPLSPQLIAKDRYGNALDAPAAAPPVVQLVALELSRAARADPLRRHSEGKARPNGPVSAAKAKLSGGGGGGGVSAAAAPSRFGWRQRRGVRSRRRRPHRFQKNGATDQRGQKARKRRGGGDAAAGLTGGGSGGGDGLARTLCLPSATMLTPGIARVAAVG